MEVKMSSIRALTKYYIVSFLIVIALAFPDQGKRDFVLSQVMNMSFLITKLENIRILGILLLPSSGKYKKLYLPVRIDI
jgi:hypothetical protein